MVTMAVNVEVQKNTGESSNGLIRRFSKKVQSSSIIQNAKKRRYAARTLSPYTRKKMAMRRIKRKNEILHLIKMGKIVDRRAGR